MKNPEFNAEIIYSSVTFCVKIIVPSLFPFMVLSNILIESGFAEFIGRIFKNVVKLLFNVNGNCTSAVLLGAVAGFPIGAKCAASLYEKGLCSKNEVERILPYCNNAGAAFVIGAVGIGIFNDYKTGLTIYIVQMISAVICGIIFSFPRRKIETKSKSIENKYDDISADIISNSIINAGTSMISICGHICFFSLLLNIVVKLVTLFTVNPYIITFVSGLFEITSGVNCAGKLPDGIAFAGLFCGWSGLSVHMQISSLVSNKGISMKYCVFGKLLQGIIMFLILLFSK